ncbi:hypothetical protein K443DRAFT_273692 [Laccaria amethystina LaAM-08-1]|uniref:Uncharacterized protein n=1 Tax=Laccaria amethystina LaAM-08-1 TaxID=1095629 RepID=A0A0C9XGF7_9AGAR|nr:hypothetical protein K443DRAFT_273692 [Laccaria amethystina LaAM-08-1]
MTLCIRMAPFRDQSPWTSWLFLSRYLSQDGLTSSGVGLVIIFMTRSYTARNMGLGRCAVIYFARLEKCNSTLRVYERQLHAWHKTRPTIAAVHRTKIIIRPTVVA